MRYLNILLACASEDWALEETKLRQVSQFLARKALSDGPEHDIEARSG